MFSNLKTFQNKGGGNNTLLSLCVSFLIDMTDIYIAPVSPSFSLFVSLGTFRDVTAVTLPDVHVVI